jgi:hypothetical protein
LSPQAGNTTGKIPQRIAPGSDAEKIIMRLLYRRMVAGRGQRHMDCGLICHLEIPKKRDKSVAGKSLNNDDKTTTLLPPDPPFRARSPRNKPKDTVFRGGYRKK